MWVLIGFGVVTVVAAVNNNQVPKTGFSCQGRTTGYYADVDSGCQVYHMCDGLGRQFSYTCPNATLFQQRMLICDHWYMVNCSKSVGDYTANLRIGRKMPFVDDSESNPYHRTPRPDLLSHPSQSEYDIIYRRGRNQFGTNLNLVGAESPKNDTTSTTDEPAYSLPSHWSTEYEQISTTSKPNKVVFNPKKNVDFGDIKGKPINPISSVTEVPVNYKSSFKATTPVFPRSVEVSTVGPDDAGLVPPLPYQIANRNNAVSDSGTTETPIQINFQSNFKATTPVYPKVVNLVYPKVVNFNTESPVRVNFQSDFKATTPVYPTSVDITSEEPADAGVLPPGNDTENIIETKDHYSPLSVDVLPPLVDVNFNPINRSNEKKEVVQPSEFYQPPKFEPDFTDDLKANEDNNQERKGGFKALNSNEWQDLRKKFFIPDYEFPLESVSRPSYDSVLSSFQASEVPSKKK